MRQQAVQREAAAEAARKDGEQRGMRAAEQAATQQLEALTSELRKAQVKGSLFWVIVCRSGSLGHGSLGCCSAAWD